VRAAERRADSEAERATRAEAATAEVRDQLDTARTDLEQAREKITELRGSVAGVTAGRDAARSDVERERAHGEQ